MEINRAYFDGTSDNYLYWIPYDVDIEISDIPSNICNDVIHSIVRNDYSSFMFYLGDLNTFKKTKRI